jgi:hypothetical protein
MTARMRAATSGMMPHTQERHRDDAHKPEEEKQRKNQILELGYCEAWVAVARACETKRRGQPFG